MRDEVAGPDGSALSEGLGAVSEARRTVRLECRLCGCQLTVTLPWGGRPQGPQCQCNPNTWGNWRRLTPPARRTSGSLGRVAG